MPQRLMPLPRKAPSRLAQSGKGFNTLGTWHVYSKQLATSKPPTACIRFWHFSNLFSVQEMGQYVYRYVEHGNATLLTKQSVVSHLLVDREMKERFVVANEPC
jgi:hypothetical protein